MSFSKEIFIHFDEGDPAGILFFGNIFAFAHRAIEEMLAESQVGWKKWFATPGYGAPLRHVEAEFINPLLPGQTYSVTVEVIKVGASSVQFETLFHQGQTPCAKVKTSHVFVGIGANKKISKKEIPIEIKEFLIKKVKSLP
ncbi:MAG: acyl-CoA thioesterase [Bdellovibrionales bacterium]|nr:acyl-CoA thioesterase [Bdellovibrionales bacterium]